MIDDTDARDIDDIDNPELTEADFAKAKPFKDVFPEIYQTWARGPGRPTINDRPKAYIGFRLAADIVDGVKAKGKGYNARVEKVLRDALARGEL